MVRPRPQISVTLWCTGRGGTTSIWSTCSWDMRRKEQRWRSLSRVRRRRRLFNILVPEEFDWRVDLPKVDGVAPRNQTGVSGPDNEAASTSLIESWSNWRAMKRGSRMIVENSPVGSLKKQRGRLRGAIQ